MLDRGRLAQWGTPLEIIEQPASDFVARVCRRRGERAEAAVGCARSPSGVRPGETAEGEPLRGDASLRDAFAAMIARRAERLPVCDCAGRQLGAIALADLVR